MRCAQERREGKEGMKNRERRGEGVWVEAGVEAEVEVVDREGWVERRERREER